MIELGNCAAYYTLGGFLFKPHDKIIKKLTTNFHRVSDFSLEKEQVVAWEDCNYVLRASLSKLPASYKDLCVIFEYVLPKHKPGTKKFLNETHIRADVILVSPDTVLVLEFKQRDRPYEWMISQAKKYQTRIEKYHVQSQGMEVKSMLVLTKADNVIDNIDGVHICSPDNLSDEIKRLMGEPPKKRLYMQKWVDSAFRPIDSVVSPDEDPDEEDEVDDAEKYEDYFSEYSSVPNNLDVIDSLVQEAKTTLEDIKKRIKQIETKSYLPGTAVYHHTFGRGIIIELNHDKPYDRLFVHFHAKDAVFLFPDCIVNGHINTVQIEEQERKSIAKYVRSQYISPKEEEEQERKQYSADYIDFNVHYSADYDELLYSPEAAPPSSPRFDPSKGFFQLDEGFGETVLNLIHAKGMTESQCYNKANISRAAFHKIRQSARDPKNTYRPTKQTAMALAIGLELSLEEAENLLERAGYAFSHSNKGDIIVEYFLINKKYDIYELNEVLYEYDQPLLGSV